MREPGKGKYDREIFRNVCVCRAIARNLYRRVHNNVLEPLMAPSVGHGRELSGARQKLLICVIHDLY